MTDPRLAAAKQHYQSLFDEDAALLLAGYALDALDEAKQDAGWRAHVAITNGKMFAVQVRRLDAIASVRSGATVRERSDAAAKLAALFAPGPPAAPPAGGEPWPERPAPSG